MYYASVAVLALIVHVIINIEALRNVKKTSENMTRLKYRMYLFAQMVFYVSDSLWGSFYEQRWVVATYIFTVMFFASMVLSVLLWTRAVVEFTGNKGASGKFLVGCGWTIFLFEIVVLIVNLFVPIVFKFTEDKEYVPLPARYITLVMQMVLFFATAVYAFVMAAKNKDSTRKFHYIIVGFSGLIMTLFIALQTCFPLLPLYSAGCLVGTCIIHSFIYKGKDVEHSRQMEAVSQKAYRDGQTGVKNKLAYLEALADIEASLENGSLKEYGVTVFDLNGLKAINDTLGHEAGDAYIKEGCMLICHKFDHSPVFRIGGDEFVAILKDRDYENREELEGSFRQMIDESQRNGKVVVASGMAVYMPGKDESYNDVFKRADEMMYKRKQELKAMK